MSLSPSTTETLFVIGAGDRVVGRSRYCDWPPRCMKLPQIGGYVDPSFEAILALRPDLVTGARGPAGAAMSRQADARGIATFLPQTESFAQIDAMILGLGERTGRTKEAKATVDALDGRRRRHREGRRFEAARDPRAPRVRARAAQRRGSASFADEMIRRAGGDNVVTEGGGYPTIGVERVMTLDPDVVVNAAIAEAHGKERIGSETPGLGQGPRGHLRARRSRHRRERPPSWTAHRRRPRDARARAPSRRRDPIATATGAADATTLGAVKVRADQLLVARGLAPTRAQAQALVLAGKVYVGEQRIDKAGALLARRRARSLSARRDHPYVSRGGVKLAGALDAFGVDPRGKRCLDLGASTGGFTDCLLQRGAARVAAVDVGYGQLAHKLRTDPRVRRARANQRARR